MVSFNVIDISSQASTTPLPPQHPPFADIGIDARFLSSQIPLDNARVLASPPSASTSSGPLGTLPAEVNSLIIEQLDIGSVQNMRRVNKAWRNIISATPSYRKLSSSANLPLLRLFLATNAASGVTISDLLALRQAGSCRSCSAPGSFLDILAVDRVCESCFRSHDGRPASLAQIVKLSGLKAKEIRRRVAVVDSLRGSCVVGRRLRREHVVGMAAARRLLGKEKSACLVAAKGLYMKQVPVVVASSVGL